MGLFDRFRRRSNAPAGAPTVDVDARALAARLREWVAARPGTEAWIEEPAGINAASVLLVALDGESRRWTVPDVPWAGDFCRKHKIPYHRAGVEPYPQRMRDHAARERARRRGAEGR